ncbi:MAG TPA: PA14 domain-containing protein, partial [Gemmataceae bacterium]
MQQRRVTGGNSWIMTGIALSALATPISGADPEPNADDLRPGLIATYSANEETRTISVTRLEPTIALSLKAGEAPHPRLPADNGKARWEGYLNILRPGEYHFRIQLVGKFRLMVDGKEVLAAESEEANAAVSERAVPLEAGVHALTGDFERTQKEARVELSWGSAQFRQEPVGYAAFGHFPVKAPAKLATDLRVDHGRFLAEERNCLACHKPADNTALLRGLQSRQGPDLSKIGERAYAGWIYRWLEAPQEIRPEAAMPKLFADDDAGRVERHAVASYLASLGGPLKPPPSSGSRRPASVAPGERLFGGIGCLACHRSKAKKANEKEVQSSFLPHPVAFSLNGLGSKTTPEKLAGYLNNPSATDPSGRMPHMLLQGNESQDLARYLCASRDEKITITMPEPPAREKILDVFQQAEPRAEEQTSFERLPTPVQLVLLGKRLVIEKGCNNCHTIAPGGKPFASVYAQTSLEDLRKETADRKACLAADPGKRGKAPWFSFSDDERKDLTLFLKEGTSGAGSPAPAFAARVTLQRFNCLACHARDGEGGLDSDLIEELRKYEKAENSEAVSPPTLTGIAHKLHTSTLRQVLVGANRVRPWMGLRMPQFGDTHVGKLPEALTSLEGAEPDDQIHKVGLTATKLEAGKQLIGKGGFGCISCHDLA